VLAKLLRKTQLSKPCAAQSSRSGGLKEMSGVQARRVVESLSESD
jgi:hypothetical protein